MTPQASLLCTSRMFYAPALHATRLVLFISIILVEAVQANAVCAAKVSGQLVHSECFTWWPCGHEGIGECCKSWELGAHLWSAAAITFTPRYYEYRYADHICFDTTGLSCPRRPCDVSLPILFSSVCHLHDNIRRVGILREAWWWVEIAHLRLFHHAYWQTLVHAAVVESKNGNIIST